VELEYRAPVYLAMHPSRSIVYSGNGHGVVRSWEAGAQRLRHLHQVDGLTGLATFRGGELLAVSTGSEVRLINASDGQLQHKVEFAGEPFPLDTFAFSPDERWLAVGGFAEEVRLLATDNWGETARAVGGELVLAMAFDPANERLVSACSAQGGAAIRIHYVSGGELRELSEIWRSDYKTPLAKFIDRISSVAWSPDSARIALFETTRVGHYALEPGWRGNIAVYDADTSELCWERTVGGSLVGDTRVLADCGYGGGFLTRIAFDRSGNVVCGSTAGAVVVLDGESGERRHLYKLDSGIDVLAVASAANGALFAAAGDGTVFPLTSEVSSFGK
jgi:WD40 repeat protein